MVQMVARPDHLCIQDKCRMAIVLARTILLGTASNTSLEVIQPIPAPNPTQLLLLNCCVLGNDLKVFTVEIEETKNVSILKKLIKEKSPIFNHIPADLLVLWKSSIPFNEDLKEDVEKLNLVDDKLLLPVQILSNVFPYVLGKETARIVVDRLHSDEQRDGAGNLPEIKCTLWSLFLSSS